MKNKIIVSMICSLLLCSLLVGCSQKEEVSTTDNSFELEEIGLTEELEELNEELEEELSDINSSGINSFDDDSAADSTLKEDEANEASSSSGTHSYDAYYSDCTLPRDSIEPLYEWYTDRSVIEEDRIADFMQPEKNYGTFDTELIFTEEILGRIMSASYEFNSDNKLISITYHCVENVTDDKYAIYYVDLFNECTKVYGEGQTAQITEHQQLISDPEGFANSADENTNVLCRWGEVQANDEVIALQFSRMYHKTYADVILMQTSPGYY